MASGRGFQPGAGVLPRPKFGHVRAPGFYKTEHVFYLDGETARNLKTDRNLLLLLLLRFVSNLRCCGLATIFKHSIPWKIPFKRACCALDRWVHLCWCLKDCQPA